MALFRLSALVFFSALTAQAVVLTLAPSTQSVTFTGLGTNTTGAGASRLTWGDCKYDGSITTCTVSGAYTGIEDGGTYNFVLKYPGNGISPLTAIASPIGSDLVYFNLTAGSFETYLTPKSGGTVNFYDLTFSVFYGQATKSCTGVTLCGVGAVGTTPGASITGPLNGQFDTTPVIANPGGIATANAYGGSKSIAPATWIEIYGTNLATTPQRTWAGGDFNGAQAPSALGGTTVSIGGKPAYVDYVSPHQVNVQVPSGIATGNQKITVTTYGGTSSVYNIVTNVVEPGILAPPVFKFGAGQYAVALFPDNQTYALPPGTTNSVPTARAKPGDTITLYGVGFGSVSPNIDAGIVVGQSNTLPGFQASFAGVPATIQFAGLVQGSVGLYQFNVVVPKVPANDATPFTFNIGGSTGTQTLLIPIAN
jgi:uncharacterized protein (TIGR03437 family)